MRRLPQLLVAFVAAVSFAAFAFALAFAIVPRKIAPAVYEYQALTRHELDRQGLSLANPQLRRDSSPAEQLTAGLNALGAAGWTLAAIEPYHERTEAPPADGREYAATYIFRRPR